MARLGGERLLNAIAHTARTKYGLTVWQWLPGEVGTHAPGSLHGQTFSGTNVGRAFDAYGSWIRMYRFSRWVRRNAPQVTEGIFNTGMGAGNLSIKRGSRVSASFWGPVVWAEHKNHVHIGV
jgi:hypothetical protein